MAGGRAEVGAAVGVHAGPCADIITVLTLHKEEDLSSGTHHVFSFFLNEKPFLCFYD